MGVMFDECGFQWVQRTMRVMSTLRVRVSPLTGGNQHQGQLRGSDCWEQRGGLHCVQWEPQQH